MGKIWLPGGGGGDGSDECTIILSDVPKGLKAVTADSDDEARKGSLDTEASAADSHVLAGETYLKFNSTTKHWEKRVGTEPNRGNWTGRIGVNGKAVIPEGYHSGSGYVDQSINNRGAWTSTLGINGKVTIPEGYHNGNGYVNQSITVSSVVSFSIAQYSNLTLAVSWAKPSKGPWSGVRVLCKQGGYPSSTSDGTVFYEGSGTSATKSLASGTWYFRAWNYLTTSAGRVYGGYSQGTCANNQIKGMKTFTSSGTFTVPANVRSIDVFCVGGGGSGGSGGGYSNATWFGRTQVGSGGAGGRAITKKNVGVVPGNTLSITVGGGGMSVGSDGLYKSGNPGGLSKVMLGNTVLSSADGGGGGADGGWSPNGGRGGSGGGGGIDLDGQHEYAGGNGGSDGGNGASGATDRSGNTANGGTGQGSTTRAFGESSGTLYAGGGGGGSFGNYMAAGGLGGGGNGGKFQTNYEVESPKAGNANTGSGGGGALQGPSGAGGSGIVIMRWWY